MDTAKGLKMANNVYLLTIDGKPDVCVGQDEFVEKLGVVSISKYVEQLHDNGYAEFDEDGRKYEIVILTYEVKKMILEGLHE